MYRRIFWLAIAIYGMWICFAACASPVLSIDAPRFDFSRIEPISNPTNAMEIANTGDSPLEIHRVRACCGAKASVSTNSIAPGESATLTVSLGPMARPGPFRKKAFLIEYIGCNRCSFSGAESARCAIADECQSCKSCKSCPKQQTRM